MLKGLLDEQRGAEVSCRQRRDGDPAHVVFLHLIDKSSLPLPGNLTVIVICGVEMGDEVSSDAVARERGQAHLATVIVVSTCSHLDARVRWCGGEVVAVMVQRRARAGLSESVGQKQQSLGAALGERYRSTRCCWSRTRFGPRI